MKFQLPGRNGRLDAGQDRWDDEPADEQTASLLSDFAAGPMSPDRETLDRMGTRLRAAFVQNAAEGRVAADSTSAPASARRRMSSRRMRFAFVMASVALVTVTGAGVAAAESGAGQPFYHARLTIEALFLPPAGTDARLAADLDRAQARLDEAQAAAAGGNWNAEVDALGAYADVVESISISANTDAGVQARLRLAEQLTILERLRAGAGDGAGSQLGRAIDDVGAILAGGSMQPRGTAAPSPNATGTGGSGQQGPSSSPGTGSSAGSGSGTNPNPSPGASGESGPQGTGGSGGQGGGAMPSTAPVGPGGQSSPGGK